MKYTSEELFDLETRIYGVHGQLQDIFLCLPLELKTNKGKEFRDYGVKRRLLLIRESYLFLTKLVPPKRVEPLCYDEIDQVAMHLNSLYLHIWGCVDNLAWLIAYELQFNNLGDTSSEALKNIIHTINLFPTKKKKKGTLREMIEGEYPDFEYCLSTFDKWILNLAHLRHPAVHRMPLYVIPYTVPKEEGGNWIAAKEEADALFYKGMSENDLESLEKANAKFKDLEGYGKLDQVFAHEFELDESGNIKRESLNPLYPTIVDDCSKLIDLVQISSNFLLSRNLDC